jgi:hypothetical protein
MNDRPQKIDLQPQVLQAQWDREQVNALFDDLQQGAEIQRVQARPSKQDSGVTLQEARQLLEQGEATAIQIRYRYDGQDWCDTLIVGAESIRIVRTSTCP